METNRWVRCRCPECGGPRSRVVTTNPMADGRLLRERRCQQCEARWFTVQEPECVVARDQVVYRRQKAWLRD